MTLRERLARLLHRLTRRAPDTARADGTVGDDAEGFHVQVITTAGNANGANLNLTWPRRGHE